MRKIALLAAIASTSLALSGCSLLYPNWGTTENPSSSQSPQPSSSQPSQSAGPSTPAKASASVQIESATVDPATGMLEVWAQATNFNEDGGQCTLMVSAGTTSKSVTVKAESNVTSTQCYVMNLDLKGLPKGTGLVTVSYDSAKYAGTSAGQSIVIN